MSTASRPLVTSDYKEGF